MSQLTSLILFLYLLTLRTAYSSKSWLQYYDATASIELAKSLLAKDGITSTKDRLPIMMLYSHPFDNSTQESLAYLQALKCSLRSVEVNLKPSTPVDVFLFAKEEHLNTVPDWVLAHKPIILPLDKKIWEYPVYVRPEDKGWSGGFSKDYR